MAELRDGSPHRSQCGSRALCAQAWHRQFFSLPTGCGGNSRTGTPIFSTSRFASLRATRLEAHVYHNLDFSGIYGTFSLTASQQFPRFPSPGRFARTQISCSTARGRESCPVWMSLSYGYRECSTGDQIKSELCMQRATVRVIRRPSWGTSRWVATLRLGSLPLVPWNYVTLFISPVVGCRANSRTGPPDFLRSHHGPEKKLSRSLCSQPVRLSMAFVALPC